MGVGRVGMCLWARSRALLPAAQCYLAFGDRLTGNIKMETAIVGRRDTCRRFQCSRWLVQGVASRFLKR